jgi:small subunit ribosomal protein S9
MMAKQYYEGVGRRKASTARVRIIDGSGEFTINEKKSLEEYFTRLGDMRTILAPLATVGQEGQWDVTVQVKGGGVTGQTDAVQLGLARALVKMNPDLKPALRREGFLTRDARVKERKKPGLKRARKAPTYTKR